MPDPIRALERAHRHPERETLELAAAGAAKVLGPDHGATKALARAAQTMEKVDLWKARLAIKTLRRGQRGHRRGGRKLRRRRITQLLVSPPELRLWVKSGSPAWASECPLWVCAVLRRRSSVGASSTQPSLQPKATGAVMEVTKWLKPSV